MNRQTIVVCMAVLALLAQPALAARTPTESSPTAIEVMRAWVVDCLVDLDRTPDEARVLAGGLTADDLAVLAAYPNMMQAAGAMTTSERTLLIIVIIVVVVIVLSVAGSGSATFFG